MSKLIYVSPLNRFIPPAAFGLLQRVKELYPDDEFIVDTEGFLTVPVLETADMLRAIQQWRDAPESPLVIRIGVCHWLDKLEPASVNGPLAEAQTWLACAIAEINQGISILP